MLKIGTKIKRKSDGATGVIDAIGQLNVAYTINFDDGGRENVIIDNVEPITGSAIKTDKPKAVEVKGPDTTKTEKPVELKPEPKKDSEKIAQPKIHDSFLARLNKKPEGK